MRLTATGSMVGWDAGDYIYTTKPRHWFPILLDHLAAVENVVTHHEVCIGQIERINSPTSATFSKPWYMGIMLYFQALRIRYGCKTVMKGFPE